MYLAIVLSDDLCYYLVNSIEAANSPPILTRTVLKLG